MKQVPASDRKKRPTVAIVSSENYPHHATTTQQVVKNASALAEAGLAGDLILPVQAKGFFTPGYSLPDAVHAYYNVPNSLKIKTLALLPAGKWRLEKISHSVGGALYAIFKKYDVTYTRNRVTALLSLLLGQKTVFETYRKLGDEKPRTMRWLARRVGRKPHFLGMILHSGVSRESILRAGFPPEKLVVVHNGFDTADMEPALGKAEARRLLGWRQDERCVVYAGNMQPNKCVESLVDIAALLPGVRFVLVGGTPEDLERLKNHARQVGAENVSFTGHQPVAKVPQYLYAADALIIPPVSAPMQKFGRTVLPFKTFLYLAAGRPLVAPRLEDLEEVLEHGRNALLVEPDNFAACAKAIERLLGDPARCFFLSENAAASARELTWENRARKIIAWLEAACSGASAGQKIKRKEERKVLEQLTAMP